MSRSSPNSSTYLKWMTFAEVNTMTSNPTGAKAIVDYLLKSNVNITSILPYHNYIRASASVSAWESLLQAKFYIFDDRNHKNQSAKSFIRAHRCLILFELGVPFLF
jgi:Pro-kumamolisin, activation domain